VAELSGCSPYIEVPKSVLAVSEPCDLLSPEVICIYSLVSLKAPKLPEVSKVSNNSSLSTDCRRKVCDFSDPWIEFQDGPKTLSPWCAHLLVVQLLLDVIQIPD
jgi:hypothetical protein